MPKAAIHDLALFGGPLEFSEPLHVGLPNIGDRRGLMRRLNRILDIRRLTNRGPNVEELERKLCETTGVRHCIPVCNGTAGLEVLARALGLEGEVIVPSMTFVATAHALEWLGITPVFCDIDPGTHNIDPGALEKLITPRTTGIIGVHLWGRACAVDALTRVAERHGLKLVFDAAHAFGCSHRGRMVGNFGTAEVFSFHATKFINSFEGGAIATNDDGLADKCRLMARFGFSGYDNVISLGINAKMSEACAAMGLCSLERMEHFVSVNRRNLARYHRRLRGLQGLSVAAYDESEKNNFQYVVVEVDEGRAGLSRDELVTLLHAENVLARRYFFPGCHRMEPYCRRPGRPGSSLHNTERLLQRVLQLPTGTGVNGSQIDAVCHLLQFALGNATAIRSRLARRGPNP